MKMDDITHVTTSIGGTPGRYNLVRSVAMPSLSYGELIIDFKSARALERNIDELQSRFSALYPDAYLLFKRYNLMFMHYPVELRFCGPDPAILHQLADSAMDVAKRLLDYGYHAPTIYFPLLFHESLMIEPTENESKQTIDGFIEVMRAIAEEARTNPQVLKEAPHNTPVGRVDDVLAATHPVVTYKALVEDKES